MSSTAIEFRRGTPDDLPAILAVATAALGWDPDDPNESFFRWKHIENPAGSSPMWVAVDEQQVVGFRTMLRWRFADGDAQHAAVRAVDTATHPHHLRRGIFRSLTTAAVDELTAEGVEFVFNTPNDKSRPGYLRMGWSDEGRLGARLSLRWPGGTTRVIRARTAAAKWSSPIDVGDTVESVIDDLVDLARTMPRAQGIVTDRTHDHLLWRYGFAPLHYRVIRADDGAAIVRLRRRGAAGELVLAEVFADNAATVRRLIRQAKQIPGVHYVLSLANPPYPTPPMTPVPGLGPHLTLRSLASDPPPASGLRFSLGDIELF